MYTRRQFFALALSAVILLITHLASSAITYRIGFPLDDAWIHQTYARNLATYGEWSFVPGQPSAGSTSPLWTMLLWAGFFLPYPPYFWTFFLGTVLLISTGWLVETIVRTHVPGYAPSLPWAGIFCMLEWRLSWLAFSGMETLLHNLLITFFFGLLLKGNRHYALLGSLIGISAWVRPDGMTLIGPAVLYVLISENANLLRLRGLLILTLGVVVFSLPYAWFNLTLSNSLWPSTFYAKQQEYAAWQSLPLVQRLWSSITVFLAGPSLLLVWGVVYQTLTEIRQRRWETSLIVLWITGYIALYALRLPPYQHGRYLMPTLGIFLPLGLIGTLRFISALPKHRQEFFQRLSVALLTALSLSFLLFGAFTYGQDVAFIESEMVDTARWVNENLPASARIAAHDIGALGYFTERTIIDLAGLISPEIIPFMRNEQRLADYLSTQNVDYLIVFPGWYQTLPNNKPMVYQSKGNFSAETVLGNMAIYQWTIP
ncbi:MAG: hypothetical protein DDG60_07615 [Anaerolineae bacterium]|nr:MAG: hypothetical protein DDG60_07615 [Anaerolineae bacterium]